MIRWMIIHWEDGSCAIILSNILKLCIAFPSKEFTLVVALTHAGIVVPYA